MWLPYILTFFPGGFSGDLVWVINQAIGKEALCNHQPILYTFMIAFFSLMQTLFMVAMVSYFVFWWYKKNVNEHIIIGLTLFFGIFKLIPLYVVTIWKETPFSLFVILFSLQIADIVLSKGEKLKENKFIALYILNILLISFLRNNGLYVVLATTICIFFTFKSYKNYKTFKITTTIIIFLIILIQGSLYNYLKIEGSYKEKLAIPIQQIAHVVVYDGNISDEQKEYINSIIPIDTIKEVYLPWNVDYLKFDSEFNVDIITQNKVKFFTTWFNIFLKNPGMYIKAYLLQTTGFWNINRVYTGNMKDYIGPISNVADAGAVGVSQKDLIYENAGFSLENVLYPSTMISSAIFIFIIFISVTYIFKTKRYKMILIYLPTLFTVATIFIATPYGFALRYVYPVVLFTPFAFLIPFVDESKNANEKEKENVNSNDIK